MRHSIKQDICEVADSIAEKNTILFYDMVIEEVSYFSIGAIVKNTS